MEKGKKLGVKGYLGIVLVAVIAFSPVGIWWLIEPTFGKSLAIFYLASILIVFVLMGIYLIIEQLVKKFYGQEGLNRFRYKAKCIKLSEDRHCTRRAILFSIIILGYMLYKNPFGYSFIENLGFSLLAFLGFRLFDILIDVFADFIGYKEYDQMYKEYSFLRGEVESKGIYLRAYIHSNTYRDLMELCYKKGEPIIGSVVDKVLKQYLESEKLSKAE